ncbi:MAG TPA: rhodanese-like domain-containing protein [Bacteroidota bacterium]|nr:rhodanese-like domain-containing protein [Bacteroidota bacterium]
MKYQSVPAVKASDMILNDAGVVLLDVRTREEYDGELGHLRDAILIPVQELQSRLSELDSHRGKNILIYCRSGRRSLVAADILQKNGHEVINVEGGMVEWNELKLPGIEYRR